MKNKNKFDAMLDVIEAGDMETLEHQNAWHISQMKTLLDDHLAQQRSILAEFKEAGKMKSSQIAKLREETSKEQKALAKMLSEQEAQIDRLSSYSEGVFLSRRVYNRCLTIFICSLVANAVLVTLAVIRWLA
ncbi:MAG: hypothetical protein IJ647_11765 [Prevotella sp.]|nr:hypothetical protein [Prevotella sp.]